MDFHQLLLDVGKVLQADEVKSLAFLCTDILNRNPGSVESASDLFYRLMDQDLLSNENPQLLRELLLIIQHFRLVRNLKLPDQGHPARNLISPYRKLLYELSEQITKENLKDIKFLLYGKMPRQKLLAENVTTLEVFLQMEQMDILSETDLKELEIIIQAVCPMLKGKIQRFKALQAPITNVMVQEEGRPRSLTDPVDPHQILPSLVKTRSFDTSAFEHPTVLPTASSCSSLDFVKPSDECDTVTDRMSVLSAGSDASERFPAQENKTPDVLKSHTANTDTEDLQAYAMTAAKRGICLIVNNNDFIESRGTVRQGTMTDENNLCAVFQWLGFEVKIHRDCNTSQMQSLLQELSKRDHSQMDCLVCCFLSHGKEGSVCGVDDGVVKIHELMDLFNGLKCPTLANKPKMFFVQACQGTKEQSAVSIESDSFPFSPAESETVRIGPSIPAVADFLLGIATVPNFVSFRHKETGSWFIQSLCQNLVAMVPRGQDLISILTKVNADVSQKSDHSGRKKQMPQPTFSLRRKVIFPVPTAPPPSLSL